jgi:hypothetical protein
MIEGRYEQAARVSWIDLAWRVRESYLQERDFGKDLTEKPPWEANFLRRLYYYSIARQELDRTIVLERAAFQTSVVTIKGADAKIIRDVAVRAGW